MYGGASCGQGRQEGQSRKDRVCLIVGLQWDVCVCESTMYHETCRHPGGNLARPIVDPPPPASASASQLAVRGMAAVETCAGSSSVGDAACASALLATSTVPG